MSTKISPPPEGGKRVWYDVRDQDCLGMTCLRLYPIQVRGATTSGSRSTGRMAYECAERYVRGCPRDAEAVPETARARKEAGYRCTR